MRAAIFDRFGPPDVIHIGDLPEPVPGPGEVVVRVAAVTVNPTDTLMRAGMQAALMQHVPPPWVAGVEFAGHVHSLGAGVAGVAVGDKVLGLVDARRPGGGGHAEYVRVAVESIARLDPAADLVAAATVAMNGLTARIALAILALPHGATLLVTGGAGAAGGYAIQLARHAGLRVIADAAETDADLLRRLGAAEVVSRGPAMAGAVRALHPGGVDGLIDAALLGAPAAELVRDGGGAIALRRSHMILDPRLRTSGVMVFDHAHDAAALAWLAARLADGTLTPRVARTLPLAEAAEAHRLVERGGLRGRIVLLP
jgi:NADPH:quinone reductase-like Zn-dependent oxidoreductase